MGESMKGVIKGMGAKQTYWLDNREVTQAEFEEAFPPRELAGGESLHGWKPIASVALAVHPRQIPAAREDALKKGVPTDFTPDGSPIFRTRQHRNAYLKAYGKFDRNAGYGDVANGTYKGGPSASERERAEREAITDIGIECREGIRRAVLESLGVPIDG
jgi:hypothetical protein